MIADLPGLFVTGTDTGVGKTRIAAAIAAAMTAEGRRVGVLKPVATGAEPIGDGWRVEDAEALIAALGRPVPVERVAPLVYREPLAPPVAARRAGVPLTAEAVAAAVRESLEWWAGPGGAEVMVVEGVGGLLCPLAEGTTVADLAVALDLPTVVVARRGLGTLNHTLLTVEAARLRGLRLAGVVLNGSEPTADPIAEQTNPAELARRLVDVPILADIPHDPTHARTPAALLDAIRGLNWLWRAAPPRLVAESLYLWRPS